MRNLIIEVKFSKRMEWCDECYNFVRSDFFITISERGDKERFFTLCRKHAEHLTQKLVKTIHGKTERKLP